jgi:GH15 family glucan-1,4-alpha-glucosidase
MTDYPPIDSHGFLSDTHTTALVTPDGAVDWLCVPCADAQSLFAAILDAQRGGAWTVRVDGGQVVEQAYEDETLVLRTRWEGPHGAADVFDLLAIADHAEHGDEFTAAHVLLRVVRATVGHLAVRTSVAARPDFARTPPRWRRDGAVWVEEATDVALASGVPLDLGSDGDLRGTHELAAGESVAFALAYDGGDAAAALADADGLIESTCDAWRAWCTFDDYTGPAREAVTRSAIVLRALSFDETGSLLAAATTSLPEELGGERNWDYRFTWHRDASLHVSALYMLGHATLGERYGNFLIECCVRGHDRLLPLAGLRGEQSAEEVVLDSLSGYAGSAPVRYGNEAFNQRQHDAYGHILDGAFVYRQLSGSFDRQHWDALRDVVDTVSRHWSEPDSGLWEVRGPRRHYVNSKLMSWVALDRGVRLAEDLDDDEAPLDEWRAARDDVRRDLLEHGYDADRGAFTMAYGSSALDASVLRIPLVGFLPGDDPRVVSTIERIAAELGEGPALIRRYDTAVVDDGVRGSEGAFLLASFEMVSALVFAGRVEEAQQRFDWLLSHAGPLGLYAEQMDASGRALGNYPQAFTHLALIEAAVNLARAGDGEALCAWALREEVGMPQ